jgi:hypothetical protein
MDSPMDSVIQELPEIQESSSAEVQSVEAESIDQAQGNQLLKKFNLEGRNRRSILKARISQAWGIRINPTRVLAQSPIEGFVDPLADVQRALDVFLAHRWERTSAGLGGILDPDVFFDEFLDSQLSQFDLVLNENKQLFIDEIYRRINGEAVSPIVASDELRQRRTAALWAGLRRVYFAELELDDEALTDDVSNFADRQRRRLPRVPTDLHLPESVFGPPGDPDDAPPGSGPTTDVRGSNPSDGFEGSISHASSQGENGSSSNADQSSSDGQNREEQDRGPLNGERSSCMMDSWLPGKKPEGINRKGLKLGDWIIY